MHNVELTNNTHATDAGHWCLAMLDDHAWRMDHKNLFSKNPVYVFSFINSVDAVNFALKWL